MTVGVLRRKRAGYYALRPSVRRRRPNGRMFPNLASQMRTAFSSMAANTGCKIARGTADNLKHFRGRGLLLQRFREVSVVR